MQSLNFEFNPASPIFGNRPVLTGSPDEETAIRIVNLGAFYLLYISHTSGDQFSYVETDIEFIEVALENNGYSIANSDIIEKIL